MKQRLVKGVRSVLPSQAVHLLENVYRKTRIQLVSARYGWPARGLRVIAVTGTNGKTTTANYINEILKQAGYKTAMFTTAVIEVAGESKINNLNATVASVSRMQQFLNEARRSKVDFVILEVTSHSLHQHKLDGVPIEAAVMTNLTQDHLDYHKTMENYAAAKAKLFEMNPNLVVLNADDEWFDYFNNFATESQKITYGEGESADVKIEKFKLYKKGSEAKLRIDNNVELEIATNLPGEFNIYNMTAAAAGAYLLGISLKDIQEGIANLEGVSGRFQYATSDLPFEVVVDYAHTPDALEKLLQTSKKITKNRTILVFGACGDRDREKRPIMGKIAQDLADRIIITDEENYTEDATQIREEIISGISKKNEKLPANIQEIPDRKEAIRKALQIAGKGDIVLITGLGHEVYRVINGEKIPWNDTQIVREIAHEIFKK